jgi:nitrogen regulatory protein PII-like uncharacterized protein
MSANASAKAIITLEVTKLANSNWSDGATIGQIQREAVAEVQGMINNALLNPRFKVIKIEVATVIVPEVK